MKPEMLKDLNELAQYRQYLTRHPQLRYLFFELTDRCNLACLHCGSSCDQHNCHYLDLKDLRKVLLDVKENFSVLPQICLTGGEPLLYPQLEEFLTMVNELGFPWGMTSNGMLIDEKTAKMLIEQNIYSISISLDGLPEAHNHLRNSPLAYQKALEGINNLVRWGKGKTVIQITSVVSQLSINELDEIYKLAESLNVDSLRLINIEPMGRALLYPQLLLQKADYRKLFDFIAEKRSQKDATMEVTYGCSHYLTDEYEGRLRDHYFLCAAGIYVASITAEGDIISCLDIERRPELIQGNIRNDKLSEVWYKRFSLFRQDHSKQSPRCRNCKEKQFCRGDSYHSYDFANHQPLLCMKDILE